MLLITSGNVNEEGAKEFGMMDTLENYRDTLNRYVGSTTVIYVGDTMQVDDYSKYNWTYFDPEDKEKKRREKFPDDLRKAFYAGWNLVPDEF